MTKFLLSLHVLAAIVAVGPITVAASMFPPSARKALAEPGSERAVSAVRLLHRICRVYGGVGIAVPVLGFATAMSMGVLKDAWLIVSMLLTALAAMVLLALVLPRQEELLEGIGAGDGIRTVDGAGTADGTGTAGETETAGETGTARETGAADGTRTAVGVKATAQLAMFTGVFNLLWATVTILMIVRPGSTTGA
ncbi:protease [Streptomyces europaeiscabiei]|uniref:protease n=1 Tax=Streptomyces europaeiscabiei TaxID=146819 RepID=UPI0006283B02|nr:protease [Streptomyces europaeiscabiei]MDX2526676.1 protease [Streptomyces europaeiscabiei]MDX3840079.1 protease [Streptomyces europaeiscabiei]MDX3863403.1 protease [Streptomyces europaeiscabiei]MDX3872866.1 protease [Streptomyces europaeiscabiei]